MNLIPKAREWIIDKWHAFLDYDTKRGTAKRNEIEQKREIAKKRRLERDANKSHERFRNRQRVIAVRDSAKIDDSPSHDSTDSHFPIAVVAHPSTKPSLTSVSCIPPASPGKMWCPFCSEEIKAEAIKCKHCGEFLDGRQLVNPSANPQYSRQSQPVQVVVKQQTSGCTWIFIIALGIVAACILMSVF